ncbi:MAG TPA: biotin/lipoyl-containing protein [Candidatus Deferrimicrobiaceae bacterium]|nr:biotin/lipoyl-containing protein [Candidatus Deferrimicrobiaceae bacterium]
MPESGREPPHRSDDVDRQADHAAITRLTDELLPALIAKLATTRLGELEVREGDWRVRLRRPYGTAPGEGRRSTDRPSRAQPGHEGHAHPRAAPEPHRAPRAAAGALAADPDGSGNGSGPRDDRDRSIATSPAVGIFRPGARAAAGTRVRAGDSLGTVDVLGVPQEVTAPVDGIVGATLVEAETAVEYGQELIRIELTTAGPPAAAAEAR